MKHSPKPFAVEIKRSRRSATPRSTEAGSLEGVDAGAPPSFAASDSPVATALRRAGARRARPYELIDPSSEFDFDVPAFLQADRPQARAMPESPRREAEQLFEAKLSPRTDEDPFPARPQPRVLPSLIPSENPELAALAAEQASATRAEPATKRGRKIAAPKERAPEPAASVVKQTKATRAPDAAGRAPGAAPSRKRSEQEEKARQLTAGEAAPARPTRLPGFMRRGRQDPSLLPRGQQWKRRLHPRAW